MSFCKLSWLICVGCVAQLYLVASEDIVEPTWLAAHLKDPNIKILDASYDLKPKPDWKEFKTKSFGKFDELIKTHTNAAYTSEHIPGAIYYNIDIAYFPGEFEFFSLYPPDLYEQYIQKLGINQNDRIIVYSRNDNAGMLYSAFIWWTLKVYGHKNVQVLNGGFDAWKKVGNPTEKGAASATAVGNWKAGPIDKSLVATFDDLTHDPKGGNLFETNMTTINMLDARPEEQFTGKTPLGFPAPKATGSHVAGAKNVPLKNVVGDEGVKDKSVLENALKSVNFDPSKPTVAMCNGGVQSSLLTLGLTRLEIKARVYIGSMAELAARASQYINSKMRGLIASLVFLVTLYSFSEAKSVSTYFKDPKYDEKVESMFTKIDVLKSVMPDEYKQTFASVFNLVFDTSKTPEVRFEEIRKLVPEEIQSKEDFEKKKAIIIEFMGKIDQLANYYTTEVAPTLTDNAKAVIKVYTDYIQHPQQFFKDGKDEMKKKFLDATQKVENKDALDLFIAAGLMANKAKQIKMMDTLDKMKTEKGETFF